MIKKTFDDSKFVVAGRVRRAWGIRGQLGVDWNNGRCPVEVGSGSIYLQSSLTGPLEEFIISIDHVHGNFNIITLKGLNVCEEANRYRGSKIWVQRDKLPKLRKGEYYSYQIIGMKVLTIGGEYLGEIAEIFPTGSNDVYVVRDGSKELLIPAIEDVVKEIDLDSKTVKVELIEGLR